MQRGNVPLAVAQCVKQLALRLVVADLEFLIERAARGEHAEVLVEHQERFAHGIDDRLRERARLLDLGEQFIVAHSGLQLSLATNISPGGDPGTVVAGAYWTLGSATPGIRGNLRNAQ